MADLTATEANIRPLDDVEIRTISLIADEAIIAGQPVYEKTNGRVAKGRANAVGTAKLVGVALNSVQPGRAVSCMYHGRIVGYDLASINPSTTVFLSSAAAGALADAAATGTGNVVVPVGTVRVQTNPTADKYLFIDIPQNAPTPTAL